MLPDTVHGYIHVEGVSTLTMEAEFSLKTKQNLQDYTVSRTDDDSLGSNSTSPTKAYSEDIWGGKKKNCGEHGTKERRRKKETEELVQT